MVRLKQLLREPLLHFIIAGAVLFGSYQWLNPQVDEGPESKRIVLTKDDVLQMTVTRLAKGLPPPTLQQLQSLIEHRVKEEILYREALALGLDKDDTIVKRRLAQKMEFLAQDLNAIKEPSSEELRAWLADNQERFALPPRVSFRHVYFSHDRGQESAKDAATQALQILAGKPRDWEGVSEAGDPFMFQDYYGDRSFDEMAKLFGPTFARSVIAVEPGSWSGPLKSGYGWHLVFVDTVTPRRVPEFEEVASEVKSDWLVEQREQAKRKAYEDMRAKYEVLLPELPGKQISGSAASAAEASQ